MNIRKIMLLLVVAVFGICSVAQAEQYKFDGYDIKDQVKNGITVGYAKMVGGKSQNIRNGGFAASTLRLKNSSGDTLNALQLSPVTAVRDGELLHNKDLSFQMTSKKASDILSADVFEKTKGLINYLYPLALQNDFYFSTLHVLLWEVLAGVVPSAPKEGEMYAWSYGYNNSDAYNFLENTRASAMDAVNNGKYTTTIDDFYVLDVLNDRDGYTGSILAFNYTPAATPIPGVAILLGSGVAGMMVLRRKMLA